MAKKKTGLLEYVAGIAATFPWWVGCVLAALAYGVLHRYAASEAVSSAVPGQVGQLVIKRTARQGMNIGNHFWGCATFPKCRGVRAVE